MPDACAVCGATPAVPYTRGALSIGPACADCQATLWLCGLLASPHEVDRRWAAWLLRCRVEGTLSPPPLVYALTPPRLAQVTRAPDCQLCVAPLAGTAPVE